MTLSDERDFMCASQQPETFFRPCSRVENLWKERRGCSRKLVLVLPKSVTEPVYMELIDFIANGTTSEKVAAFRPSAEAQQRVSELLERNRESQLTEDETAELDAYCRLEHILGLAKAKARLILAERN